MLYLILTFILLVVIYKVYDYTKYFFDDGIDYNINHSKNKLNALITKEINLLEPGTKQIFHQFNNIRVPYKNSFRTFETVLITNSGVFILDSRHYSDPLVYSGFEYSKQNTKTPLKLFIPSNKDKQSINCLYDYLPSLNNLQVYSKFVFTSQVEFLRYKPSHIMTKEDFAAIFKSTTNNNMSTLHTSMIVGALATLNAKNIKNNISSKNIAA